MRAPIIFCFLFILSSPIVSAQNEHLKHDYIWLTGYSSDPTQLEFGGTVFDFHEDTLDVYYEYRDIDFNISNNTMSDENGELIFSSNGTIIANRLNEVMENGEGINPETSAQQDILFQGILALPSPNEDSTYLLLHAEITWIDGTIDGNWSVPLTLYKSIVDMSFNSSSGDLGFVVEKNIPILEDTLAYGRLTATRHANGRDWWILQQQYSTNKFYRFLLSPEGLIEQEPQIVGENVLHDAHGLGQAVFSPDGSKYAVCNAWDFLFSTHVDFYDFDRCTGLLSNFERIVLDVGNNPRGLAVSPNSKYAYLTTTSAYYQIDLEGSPKELNFIQEQADTASIAFLGQLAPNGKIYFCGFGGHQEMHVIHNPNEEGIACNIEQGGLSLPTYNNGTIPNHPNYRLGRLIGSPCDTIYNTDTTSIVNTPIVPQYLDVYPNPSSSNINFKISEAADFRVTDYLGRIVKKGRVRTGENVLDVSDLVSGVYFLTLEGEVSRIARFVVQKE